ncbi:MAG: HD domain-containing protein [Candidatus Eremiobacteraeota bacterium]|nr:HD domain-containing protein [Candidatus Eremiobacteraeota bacterium]
MKRFDEKTVKNLLDQLGGKDKFTMEHSLRVSKLAGDFARHLGWKKENIAKLKIAAMLHDLGKLDIPDEIFCKIRKASTLTDEDKKTIRQHTGHFGILEEYENIPKSVKDTLKYHHEKHDGTGYHEGLRGDEIPEGVKIVAIADYYDTVIVQRPNKVPVGMVPLSKDEAIRIMIENTASRFDPKLMTRFLELILGKTSKEEKEPAKNEDDLMSAGSCGD